MADTTQQALNRAMMEAVDFIHAEGWDAPPTLFGLVPHQYLPDHFDDAEDAPLTLVVQDNLPDLTPGSAELADYLSRIAWPPQVVGVILAQEIRFRDTAEGPDAAVRPARLFSGVLRGGEELTLIQRRPSEEELAAAGRFAHDEVELRGGDHVAPEVIAALRYGLDHDPAAFDV
ncbi:hypothetical protein H7347_04665 [Corynebacterium sp. zg-331]|uniref:PPA1309 family protein n=1 Tax=unclassified Corynebacterium TaxID=2624378 RepID=UPI00128B566D|nr:MULTISPECIES: PPA1309 family protein [unclassified Corynebacterium]MBC3185868.1 hypothetical protein [Corynebacterium sp. zg-331]MPV52359.1 hypothetical protein [Corynebacterium sp. zg331]